MQDPIQLFILSSIFWAIFIGVTIGILCGYKLGKFLITRFITKTSISLDLINGIKIILRIICIITIFILFIAISPLLFIGGIPQEVAILIAAVTGTIVALSSTTVIQNFIAGLYVIITQPYELGDLVRIGEEEGIVDEISLNHTKIRRASGTYYYVSNQSVLKSKIINYTVPKEKVQEIKEISWLFLKGAFIESELVRYAFELEFSKPDPGRTKQILQEISTKYEEIFKFAPKFVTTALVHKVKISCILTANDPELILKHKHGIIEDIYILMFGKSKKTVPKSKKPKKTKAKKAKK